MSSVEMLSKSPSNPRPPSNEKSDKLRERKSRKIENPEDKKSSPPLLKKRDISPPMPNKPPLPIRAKNELQRQNSNSSNPIAGDQLDSWNRYYSPRKEHWFMYNHTTGEMFWEAKKVGDRWEQFMAPTGLVFYLNTVTGDVVFEPPVPPPETEVHPAKLKGNSGKDLLKEMIHDTELERGKSHTDIAVGNVADIPVKSIKSAILDKFHSPHQKHRFMWDPQTPARISWDFFIIIPLLVYLSVVMPFKMCFNFDSKPMSIMFLWELMIDIIFMCDIILNFRTGYLDEHDVTIMDPGKVAWNYTTSWLALDVISGIPFSVLDMNGMSSITALKALKSSRVLKALRILRFLKLTRLLKGTKFIQRIDRDTLDTIEDFMADPSFRSVMRLLRISFLISYTTHIMACFWVLVGRVTDMQRANLDDGEEYPDNPYVWRDAPDSNWLMAQGYTYKDTQKKKIC
mmetsp:Transcript_34141/g.44068  ORF Transcript_34141/g.44068 Transcript_34141/m.44068 type:complete len:456 (+) Transcript_34141:104-1471(+)